MAGAAEEGGQRVQPPGLIAGAFHDRSNQIFGFFARPFAILMKLGL